MTMTMAGCVSTGPQVESRREAWEPVPGLTGLRIRTAHYDIYTTARDEVLIDHLPAFMESAFEQYRSLMSPPGEAFKTLSVYLFETRPQWAAFTRQFVPRRAPVYLHIKAGGYMDQATASTVIWDLGRDRTLSLLAHEGWHQYLAAHFPEPVVPWLNEGCATQWESFDLKGGRPVFRPRQNFHRLNSLREALAADAGWIPLPQLLRMHAGQAIVQTGQTTRGYYAQVWTLTLFLRTDPQWSPRLADLLADAGSDRLAAAVRVWRINHPEQTTPPAGEIVFRHYITEDLASFELAYQAFARALAG